LTIILSILQLIFIGLTIAFLIVEYRSDEFAALNCPGRMIIHPIIMVCVSFCNVLFSIFVCYYYNVGIKNPEVRRSGTYYLRRTARLLCYNWAMCFYYVFCIAFLVFVIVGQLLLFADTPLGCMNAFRRTIAFDYVLVGIFFSILLFGVFFLCCSINANAADGFDFWVLAKFFAHIMTFGMLFKDEFTIDHSDDLEEDADMEQPRENLATNGVLPTSHYYGDEQLTIQNREQHLHKSIKMHGQGVKRMLRY
jgi:hypothetical protein